MTKAYLIVNFGGPRDLQEIAVFLRALLTDQDVVRTGWPQFLHNLFFSRIAKKRATKIAHDYASIGGGSPIYKDTEELASKLRQFFHAPVLTFHRYLPTTHKKFIEEIEKLDCEDILVFPMFPQFTYATTGSIARWLSQYISPGTVAKLRWYKSYPAHPAFIRATQYIIREFLNNARIALEDVFFLFSAHGIPQKFISTGDPYQRECEASYQAVMAGFKGVPSLLSYQSKFGKGEWLRPYTEDIATQILDYHQNKSIVIVVPISFTSDHIETLFEIEQLYLPLMQKSGIQAYRCPALGLSPIWIEAIQEILGHQDWSINKALVRT